jgi:hypothetical protein
MGRTLTPRYPRRHRLLTVCAIVLIFILGFHSLMEPAYGNRLGSRELQLLNNNSSAITTYQLSFVLSTAGLLGSMSIQFCANNPTIGDPCDAPAGFDASAAVLSAQTGATNFSISNASTANQLILTRTAAATTAVPVSYSLTGITNPSSPGAYYVRLQTFANSNASGGYSDYGGIAFVIINSFSISAEVPPYLIFCAGVSIPALNCDSVTGTYVNFGELSPQAASYGLSQMMVATNANDGYSVTISGTTMESGNNVINPLTTADVSRPGTSQFGLNLTDNASPAGGDTPEGPGTAQPVADYDHPNFFQFIPGDIIVSNPTTDNLRRYTISYMVNVPSDQAPGVYASTMTFICLANF